MKICDGHPIDIDSSSDSVIIIRLPTCNCNCNCNCNNCGRLGNCNCNSVTTVNYQDLDYISYYHTTCTMYNVHGRGAYYYVLHEWFPKIILINNS